MSRPPGATRLPTLGSRGQGWFLIQLALMLAVVGLGLPPNVAATDAVGAARIAVGAALIVGGLWIAFLGGSALGANITAMPRPRDEGTLVEDGIYAHIRHPVYAGLLVAALGWALLAGSWASLVAALVLAAFLDVKSRREEAWLEAQFPAYPAYRQRTHRFIPGVY